MIMKFIITTGNAISLSEKQCQPINITVIYTCWGDNCPLLKMDGNKQKVALMSQLPGRFHRPFMSLKALCFTAMKGGRGQRTQRACNTGKPLLKMAPNTALQKKIQLGSKKRNGTP